MSPANAGGRIAVASSRMRPKRWRRYTDTIRANGRLEAGMKMNATSRLSAIDGNIETWDPELLSELVLGDTHAGPGLLRRIEERLESMGHVSGPTFKTGSIMGMTDHHHDDSEDETRVFVLYLALRNFLGLDSDASTQKKWLRRYRLSDIEAITGSRRHAGLLSQARDRVKGLLHEPSDMDVSTVRELAMFLLGWMGNVCLHVLVEVPTFEGAEIKVLECPCGVVVGQGRNGEWLAV